MITAHPSLRRLLHEVIDYAGLFPPAALTMPEAVVNYAAYRTGSHAWMLGRFIVTAARLPELSEALAGLRAAPRTPWRVSAVLGDDADAEVERVEQFNVAHVGLVRVDSVEMRVAAAGEVASRTRRARERFECFVEAPADEDLDSFAAAVARAGVRAKVRTGGVTADAFPTTERLAAFLGACADRAIAFKATAGLHHPLRASYRLTYEPGAPQAVMHGFLNVLFAAAIARRGARGVDLQEILEAEDAVHIQFGDGVGWGHWRLVEEDLRFARAFMLAFGSCSFTEPIEDLASLQLP